MKCSSPFYTCRVSSADSLKYLLPEPDILYPDLKRYYNAKHHVLRIPFDLYSVLPYRIRPSFQEVRCGQCLSCRLNKAQDWSNRVWLEAHTSPNKYFLTLTYDDDHIPYHLESENSGECVPTLCKDHVKNFWKRFRKFYGDGIRMYTAAEYGEQEGHRPHYHAIVWNMPPFDDLVHYTGFGEQTLYNSARLHRIWNNGFCTIGSVTNDSIAYTCRYILKKQNESKEDLFAKLSLDKTYVPRQNEFCTMSRMPGIARAYYDSYSETFRCTGSITLPFSESKGGTYQVQPPRYFEYLFKKNHNFDEEYIHQRKRDYGRSSEQDLLARRQKEQSIIKNKTQLHF